MAPDTSTTAVLAPLEAHAEAQVKHLLAIAAVVRELQTTEAQYAQGYSELPFQIPTDSKQSLEQLPQLSGVCDGFGRVLREFATVKGKLASELTKEVLEPLESFTTDHGEKARHLLSELYELLQKEKAFDLAYQQLHEGCVEQDTLPTDEEKTQLQQTHMERLLRKRDAERHTIQQWITALHFADQRYKAQACDVVKRTLAVYDRMAASSTALVEKLQTQLSREGSRTGSSADHGNNSISSEKSWESLIANYDCHIALTIWMSELFKNMVPVEQKATECLQKVVKLDRVVGKNFDGGSFSSRLSGLIEYHGLLTMNIEDPIMRTLKFSKEKLERMGKELGKTMEETRAFVGDARARVSAKMPTPEDQNDGEEDPIRCDSMTSSETSEIYETDNNESNRDDVDAVPEAEVASESTPENTHLQMLERKLMVQTREMAGVLEQTSYLSVKTMELIVQDHLKHVKKAISVLMETIHTEPPKKKQDKIAEKAAQPWDHIAEMLSIGVMESADLEKHGQDAGERPRCSSHGKPSEVENRATCQQRHRRIPVGRRISQHDAPLPGRSFGHTAVSIVHFLLSIVCWAAVAFLKFARAQLPPSVEERVVGAGIAAMILTMISICTRSGHLQDSWSDLVDIQSTNLHDLVKLSLDACAQQATGTMNPSDSNLQHNLD